MLPTAGKIITPTPMTDRDTWFTYMLLCNDRSLYTGITKDIDRRLEEHNSAKNGARYTRPRRPVRLVFLERFSSRSAAAKREHQLKRLSKAEKQKLVHRAAYLDAEETAQCPRTVSSSASI